MRTFWSQPLRRQLILSSLLLGLGPLVGLTIWSSIGSLRTHRTDLEHQAQIVANTIANGLSRDLLYLDAVAKTLTDDPAFRTLDPEHLQARLDQALVGRPVFLGMAVMSRGAVLARVTSATAPPGEMVPLAVDPGAQVVRRAQH